MTFDEILHHPYLTETVKKWKEMEFVPAPAKPIIARLVTDNGKRSVCVEFMPKEGALNTIGVDDADEIVQWITLEDLLSDQWNFVEE